MKVIIDRLPFVECLSTLNLLSPAKPTTPILGVVRISAETRGKEYYVRLSATDFEITASIVCPVKKVEKEGVVILPVSKLLPILREINSDHVTLQADLAVGLVSVENESYKIVGLSDAEYPRQENPKDCQTRLKLEKDLLEQVIQRSLIAVSNEPIRYCLSGVRVSGKDGELVFASTDGRRISYFSVASGQKFDSEIGTTMPPKALQLLQRLLPSAEEVTLGVSENYSIISSAKFEIFARSIEGNYPDIKSAIPGKFALKVSVNRSQLVSSLRKLSLLTDKETRPVTLTVVDGTLGLEGSEAGTGEGKISLDCRVKGLPVQTAAVTADSVTEGYGAAGSSKIRFKIDYMLDFLSVAATETVDMYLNSATEIAAFQEPDKKDYKYLLMPIVIRE